MWQCRLRSSSPPSRSHRTALGSSREEIGSDSSLYAYHRRTPFVDALFQHELPIRPRPHQGYIKLSLPGPEPIAAGTHDGDRARRRLLVRRADG
ncbi:tRNA-dependent cyclodipeptide synthase [Nocardia sp.]|uniref:tRNA-dependent cyclodipeptide synthase n=1 Tax=Nocardia sp. TaxID=1821 RepID=UPI00345121EB